MELNRNQQHFIVMTAVYNVLNDVELGRKEDYRNFEELISNLCEMPYEQVPSYIKATASYSINKYDEIVNAFAPKLKNWKWQRIPALCRAILVMSYAHFYYVEKVDKKVVIDVAVNLAKKYLDNSQAHFINAILDEVLN